jgi:diguanylate cyclase (GGDEF)-like protein/PAS domain S-box-containing protein
MLTQITLRGKEILALALIYFLAARFGLLLAIPPGYASPVWPAAGIALAAVLIFGNRVTPGIWLGSFMSNVVVSFDATSGAAILKSVLLPAGFGVGASLQAIVGAILIRRFVGFPTPLDRVPDVVKFLGLGGPASCLISASMSVTMMLLANTVPASGYAFSWWTWWIGDAIGVLVATPLVLIWFGQPRALWRRRRNTVALPICLAFAVILGVFSGAREPIFAAPHTLVSWAVLAGGMAFTGLLGAFLLVISGHALLFEQLLAQGTKDLERASKAEQAALQLAAIVTSSDDAIISHALDGTIVSWNAGAARMYGYGAGEMLGRPISILAPPELADEVSSILARLQGGERVEHLDTVRVCKDGRRITVSLTVSLIRNGSGIVTGAAAIARDMSERNHAKEALWISEQKYRLLMMDQDAGIRFASPSVAEIFGYAPDAMLIVRADGVIDLANAQAARMFHYELKQLIGLPVESLLPERFRGKHIGHRRQFISDAIARPMGSGRTDLLGLRSDGTEFPVEISLNPLDTPGQKNVVAAIRDITVRKRGEQAALQLAAIVNSSDDAIIGKTLEGTIVSWNAGAERMFGYRASEMLGQSMAILTPPDLPDDTAGILEHLRRGERVEHHDTVRVHKDGRRIDVSLTVSPILDANATVTGVSLIGHDISERKRVEGTLREKEARIHRLVESNIIGVTFWNVGGTITEANHTFLQLIGYSREELLSGTIRWPNITPPEYHAADELAIEELLNTGACKPYEKEYIRKDGQRVPVLVGRAMLDGSRDQGVGFVLDLSARKQAEERVRFMADHDALTGLPNRVRLQDRMHQAIASAHRNQGRVAIMFIDLDYFKNINDSLGHHIGDAVLKTASIRLQKCCREGDSVARLGGDEFVLCLPLAGESTDAARVAQKALDALVQPFIVEGHALHLSGSIGISLYPDDGDDVETLMRTADTAMYHAKGMGRGNFQYFTPALNQAAQQRFDLGARLRLALAQNEFVLHYQPQVDMESGVTFSTEALLRWQRPGSEPVSCGVFIANAEESGLIVPIGEWALRQACRQLKIWRDTGHPDLKMAVNLSPRQLEQANFCALVRQILNESGIPAAALELEITESILLQRSQFNLATLTRLSDMGIRLTVDDFGTGYSSLAYLQRFPVHALKIDQSFVHDIGKDVKDTALITAIIAMAASLHLEVIAEGVETSQQAKFLMAHGCREAQGYYYSKAMPAEALSELLLISK